jgi:hypothetical protein
MIRMEVSNMQSFLDYFGKIHERTMRAVAWIPLDKIEWRAAAGKFTLGDLALGFLPFHARPSTPISTTSTTLERENVG